MSDIMEKLRQCEQSVRAKTSFVPKIALVLGSGLGGFGESVKLDMALPYDEIEGFPRSTAPGHKGQFLFGYVNDVPVVVMQGRIHYYEGYPIEDVVLPIRLMGRLGAKVLFLTNAAGGINFDFSPGDFMLIEDQISSLAPSPLIGPNLEELGTRFPDMSEIYHKPLRAAIAQVARQLSIPLKKGVYIQTTGPQFETPAEIHMARTLGADAVGMSTCCEAIAARHMGMLVCGVSCIANMASGMLDVPLSGDDVNETAARVGPLFEQLVAGSVTEIAKLV